MRSLWPRGDSEDAGDENRVSAGLFRCSECERVYIATDKRTCSNCNGAVQQVPATLST